MNGLLVDPCAGEPAFYLRAGQTAEQAASLYKRCIQWEQLKIHTSSACMRSPMFSVQ